jgi:hypothetical protein
MKIIDRLLHRTNPQEQLQFEGMTEQPDLNRLRRTRNRLIVGGLALLGVTIGIEAVTDIEPKPKTNETSIVESFRDMGEFVLPVLPGVLGGGMLLAVPGVMSEIHAEKERLEKIAQGQRPTEEALVSGT